MVYTYTASDHQELCRAWVAQIRKHKYGHPFDPVTVVVPNMDMARWLQLQLADVAGISANIRFVLPAAWLREQFEALNPAVKDVLLDKSRLQWMIYTLLEEDNGAAPWSHLNYWVDKIASRISGDGGASRSSGDGGAVSQLGNVSRPGADVAFGSAADGSPEGVGITGGGSNVSKPNGELVPSGTAGSNASAVSKSRWDIASQLADAFDQYIMYRPDWLVTWQGEKLSPENSLGELPTGEAAHWQSALWSALCSRWPDIPNRADLWHAYMRRLASGESAGSLAVASGDTSSMASPAASTGALEGTSNNTSSGASQGASSAASPGANPIFAYGLSTLPLPIMRSFARHARSTDWHWFVQRRTISERSYLTDLNNYSREQATVFAEVLQKEGVDGGVVRVDADSTQSRPEPRNNLQRIQWSVADDVPLALDEADAGSVRMHVCHSARREVEVLYDSLLDLFNTTDVRPGDVAVVTPDPDA
ncbi:MAG: exodeoxyribonuclease V subunit gamma, partial [Balneolales bacterium]|nr:exodeoxyribonuclease V subunit gamma [Balneolales bacterium]